MQSVEYYRDPFKFVPISQIAEIADKFTRNEIASSNEMRGAIGWRPSKDPKANELRNSNMPQPADASAPTAPDPGAPASGEMATVMQDALDELDASLSGIYNDLGVDENA